MEDLIAQLKNLNLTDKEARVYLALLELGPATPYKIAKRSRLKRPTAYVIAEELVEKGLIIQVTGEKNKLYIARSPETYFEDAEAKLHKARKVLPELLALQRKTSEKPNILYFEGTQGIKQAYDYRLKEFHNKEIVGFFARSTEVSPELNEEVFFPWNRYKVEHNIATRIFTVDEPGLQVYGEFLSSSKAKSLSSSRFLPEDLYSADTSLEIFGWGVRIVIMDSKQALIMESSKFARSMKEIFEILWSKTEGEYATPKHIKLASK
jgi:HTH-type transcriptional regulator, sugar sensing transcriptional regulator